MAQNIEASEFQNWANYFNCVDEFRLYGGKVFRSTENLKFFLQDTRTECRVHRSDIIIQIIISWLRSSEMVWILEKRGMSCEFAIDCNWFLANTSLFRRSAGKQTECVAQVYEPLIEVYWCCLTKFLAEQKKKHEKSFIRNQQLAPSFGWNKKPVWETINNNKQCEITRKCVWI